MSNPERMNGSWVLLFLYLVLHAVNGANRIMLVDFVKKHNLAIRFS